MAVNKNFVVKNGIEIAVNLIYGDTDLQKVGIGSTTPRSLLDVHGDFIAEKGAYITGIATAVDELNVGLGGTALTVLNSNGFSGFNITDPVYNVDVRRRAGAGDTAAYFHGQVNVNGTLVPNNLRVAGLSTLSNVNIDDGEVEIAKLEVTGISTFADIEYDEATGRNINITGVGTISNFNATNAYVSGITTLGTVEVSNGQIQATTGIVTYIGDGSQLVDLPVATIGLGSEGQFIGAGVTQINFNSTSGSAIAVNAATAGIATVTLTPGVSIGLAIALGS
tara:strand:+ start:2436 stop:3275 length:840 start_codon:yes stop_codon:yes gene_type:complete